MKSPYLAVFACLVLSACGAEWGAGPSLSSDDPPPANCGSNDKGSRAEREAGERQCIATDVDAKVQRQQALHDHGMAMPQPW